VLFCVIFKKVDIPLAFSGKALAFCRKIGYNNVVPKGGETVRIVNLKNPNIEISLKDGCGLCLGHFDGVHIGHKALIAELKAMKKRHKLNVPLGVMCFSTPPTLTLDKNPTPQLTTLEEKLSLLKTAGLDFAVIYDFPAIKDMEPDEFIRRVLIMDCNTRLLVCGFNYSFGAKGAGKPELLEKHFASQPGCYFSVVPPVTVGPNTVSSTLIRKMLLGGHPDDAARLMGHAYTLSGTVEKGLQIGRTLDLPTANLAFPENVLVPLYGVYAVFVTVGKRTYKGICNVGLRPTVGKSHTPNCETFLFDFNGDIYDRNITVSFIKFIREEQKFNTLYDLQTQITRDIETAKLVLEE
jgi:riboflavin kinase/FMN adenylyltransferase